MGSAPRRKVNQRDQKDEEETDMTNESSRFNMRKESDAKNVHQSGNQYYHPVKHSSVPAKWLIAFDVENHHSLDQLSCYKRGTSEDRLSCEG